jgi:hypothetical protein
MTMYYVSGFETGFRRTPGFHEGISGIPRNIDENLVDEVIHI